jgi:hypothetical protein
VGALEKLQLFCKPLVGASARAGLQMCCNVGGVSFFFFFGGKKKQNKFPSDLHCPIKKLNPFLFQLCHFRICLFVCTLTLVANVGGMKCWGFRNYEPINRQEPLPAGDALEKPLKPQYFMTACCTKPPK